MTARLAATHLRIRTRLLKHYTPAAVQVWMTSIHPQLDARPIDLINAGKSNLVEQVIDRLDGDVYL